MPDALRGSGPIEFRIATVEDREQIFAMRHEVYARELRQHAENARGRLADDLDGFNEYVVAVTEGRVIGFVSITPPDEGRYSIDKYLSRDELPFPFDDKLYEIRILTVLRPFRTSLLCGVMMFAAWRWIEARGGTRIVAIGRDDLLELYGKIGLRRLGRRVRSGALTFELMTGTVAEIRQAVMSRYVPLLSRVRGRVIWNLDLPYLDGDRCEHGGAFFTTLGPRFEALERRHEIINADVLDAWFPPAPEVLDALRRDLPWLARTSPPNHAEGLVAEIARARGVPESCVVPGAGSSELIFRAFRQWLDRESRALLIDPTYGEYEHVLRTVIGCQVEVQRVRRRDGYRLDLDALVERARRGHDLIVVVNPNNPTGLHVDPSALTRAIGAIPNRTRVWIDETYVEFAGGPSLEAFAAEDTRTYVCKSMSKAYALSGLRVGYLIAPAPRARELLRWTPPWPVSLPGQVAAVRALRSPAYYRRRYVETARLRGFLAREVPQVADLDVLEGRTNSILCHLPERGPTSFELVESCRRRGLFVRDLAGLSREFRGRAVRVAVKDEKTIRRMLAILREVAGEIGLQPAAVTTPTSETST